MLLRHHSSVESISVSYLDGKMRSIQIMLWTVLCATLAVSLTYYVTPTLGPADSTCNYQFRKPCHDLTYYADNAEMLLHGKENVSLLFLDGIHTILPDNGSFELFNVESLTISGVKQYGQSQLCFIIARSIRILNTSTLTVQDCFFNVTFFNMLEIEHVLFNHAVFTKSELSTTAESTEITNTEFIFCVFRVIKVQWFLISLSTLTSSSVSLMDSSSDIEKTTNNESNSNFEMSETALNQSFISLSLIEYGSHSIVLKGVTFSGKMSRIQGYIQSIGQNGTVLVAEKCRFIKGSNGILLISNSSIKTFVSGCEFHRNQLGLSITVINGVSYTLVENTVFTQLNHNLQTNFLAHSELSDNQVILRNVSYNRNKLSVFPASVVISGPVDLTIENCAFTHNVGVISTLFLRIVNVSFSGRNVFTNNIGSTGGAMYMTRSTMWLNSGTYVSFENNIADNPGGAIFLEEDKQNAFLDVLFRAEGKLKCFYQLNFDTESSLFDWPLLNFNNNSAEIGGNDIYGASLAADCEVTMNGSITSNQVKDHIFSFHSKSLSSVSSSPKRVCLCGNNIPQCDNVDYIFWNVSVTSGEKFNLSLAVVGDDFGTVTGTVYASNPDNVSPDHSLGRHQKLQQITNKECNNIEYSVHSENEGVMIYLSRDRITASSQRAIRNFLSFDKDALISASDTYHQQGIIKFNLLYVPITVTVNIVPCPLGFILEKNRLICQCESFFFQYIQQCRIENKTGLMYRNGTVWLSTLASGPNSTMVLAHKLCPFGYCRPNIIAVSLDQPDTQCDFNHSGILCGGCPRNFTLALGSSTCLQCPDNRYLALFPVFVLAGIALVFFIKILDLTVARGTINGLILYANLVWINQRVFFSCGSDQTSYNVMKLFEILRVFVAWLNLDLGIETCFINGLDAYWKTWLQFLFPLYLWILAALIIAACHYSTRVTRFFGNNAVSVLATVVMLSYVKLLRTIVTIFGFAVLEQYYPNGTRCVWLEDGNIPYMSPRHAVLFVCALMVLVFLWLPFTLLLLFIPFLKKVSNSRVSRWISKFKPLFDAYYGPLKDNHTSWIGFTLALRIIVAILTAAIQTTSPTINLDFAVVMTILLIIPLRNAYKDKCNLMYELLFLVNFIVIGIAYLSTTDVYSRMVCTCVSVLVGVVLFGTILVFHARTSLKALVNYYKSSANTEDSEDSNIPAVNVAENEVHKDDDPASFVTRTTIELRECILET